MGPPPPPPPPPLPPTTLPPGKWKTENASRRINDPVPPPSKPSRPTVDAAALQHAAARLRKTGYNEPIRGDIENLSDGRMDGQNKRVFDGNRTNSSKHDQLEFSSPGSTILPPATYSSQPRQIGNIYHRDTNPINTTQNQPILISKEASSNYSNKNNNSFSSSSSSQPLSFDNYTSPYSSKYSYPTNFRSYHKDDDYFDNSNTISTNNNNGTKKYGTTETVLEWAEPYNPSKITTNQPILNARERIHDYSTTNYVYDDTPSLKYQPIPSINDEFKKSKARNFVQSSLAAQLRDEGLTESQKEANRYQKSTTSTTSNLPFDVSRIVQDAYSGDEVDHLVHQMRNNLQNNHSSSPVSVVQYPHNSGPSKYSTAVSSTSTSTTTNTRRIMNINVCVGCGKEITADQPGCNAMNQIFHVDCFKCGKCQKTLAGASFYNIDDKPTCENCYQESLEKCTACNKSINDKLLRACGGVYHVNCFVCFSCKKSLDGIPFTLDKENNVHCVPCFHDKYAPRCAVCSRPIIPQDGEKESVRVVAMDKSFHVDCYKCEDCGLQLSSKLEGQGCYPIDQHLLCKTCNGNRLRVMSSA